MVDGTITFTVDNGRGPITAVFKPPSNFQFCDGKWHEIHGKFSHFDMDSFTAVSHSPDWRFFNEKIA
jgi:hypothetical protein